MNANPTDPSHVNSADNQLRNRLCDYPLLFARVYPERQPCAADLQDELRRTIMRSLSSGDRSLSVALQQVETAICQGCDDSALLSRAFEWSYTPYNEHRLKSIEEAGLAAELRDALARPHIALRVAELEKLKELGELVDAARQDIAQLVLLGQFEPAESAAWDQRSAQDKAADSLGLRLKLAEHKLALLYSVGRFEEERYKQVLSRVRAGDFSATSAYDSLDSFKKLYELGKSGLDSLPLTLEALELVGVVTGEERDRILKLRPYDRLQSLSRLDFKQVQLLRLHTLCTRLLELGADVGVFKEFRPGPTSESDRIYELGNAAGRLVEDYELVRAFESLELRGDAGTGSPPAHSTSEVLEYADAKFLRTKKIEIAKRLADLGSIPEKAKELRQIIQEYRKSLIFPRFR